MTKDIIILSVLIILIDSIYLSLVGKPLFGAMIKNIQGTDLKMNIPSAVVTYIFIILGMYYFIISPNKTPMDAFILGICIYAVFDFTNMTLFQNYDLKTAIIDTLGGGILFYIVTSIFQKMKK